NVLDVSKIESGKFELEAIPFDPGALVRDVAGVLSPAASGKGLRVSVELEDVPPRVVGDPGRLRQVLMNLIGNAVKFTSSGEVTVAVSPLTPDSPLPQRGEGQGRGDVAGVRGLRFAVTDT